MIMADLQGRTCRTRFNSLLQVSSTLVKALVLAACVSVSLVINMIEASTVTKMDLNSQVQINFKSDISAQTYLSGSMVNGTRSSVMSVKFGKEITNLPLERRRHRSRKMRSPLPLPEESFFCSSVKRKEKVQCKLKEVTNPTDDSDSSGESSTLPPVLEVNVYIVLPTSEEEVFLHKCVCSRRSVIEVNCDGLNARNIRFNGSSLSCLAKLSATQNSLSSVPFISEPVFNIKSLVINNNNIKNVDAFTLMNFRGLEELNLSENEIVNLDLSQVNLPDLYHVDISQNNLRSFSSKRFDIHVLNMSRNSIENISFVSALTYLELLDLSHNAIDNIPKETFKHLSKLKYLNISHNKIRDTSFVLKLNASLNVLKLSNNYIKQINAKQFSQLKELYLDSNRISVVDFSDFPDLLDILDLSNNYVSNISRLSLDSCIVFLYLANNSLSNINFLTYMTNLKTVDLSYNDLRYINTGIFQNEKMHINLKSTNLNSINSLRSDVRVLNIENNNISCLPHNFFNRSHNLISLNLSNNPMENLLCPLPLRNRRLFEVCNASSYVKNRGQYIEIDMRNININNFITCVLQRGRNVLGMCHQKFCSGVKLYCTPSFLTIAAYLMMKIF